jgi:hypothetical protein
MPQMPQIQALLTKIPHLIFLLLIAVLGGGLNYIDKIPVSDLIADLSTKPGITALLKGAVVAGLIAAASILKPATAVEVNAVRARAAAAKAATAILMVLLVTTQSACIGAASLVPVTPDNTDRVNTCKSDAVEHNGFVLGGIALGAASTGAASIGAALPSNQKDVQTGLIVGSLIGTAVTTFALGGAGLTAAAFTNTHCADLVGNLPMKVQPAVPSEPSPPTTK